MTRELTKDELQAVEEQLVEHFAITQYEVAARLGIKPQPDGSWSDADADRIMAEIDRQCRPMLMDRFLLD